MIHIKLIFCSNLGQQSLQGQLSEGVIDLGAFVLIIYFH